MITDQAVRYLVAPRMEFSRPTALLLTAGPAALVGLLAWGPARALAWHRYGQGDWAPWWWAWVPAVVASAGVAAWWGLTGQTVEGLRAALLVAQRASVAFAAGLVVDGHPAPLEREGYLSGTLPLALVVGTLAVAGWDAWCRVCDRREERRLVAERQAADARRQEEQRQQEEERRRQHEAQRHEALRRQQEQHRRREEERQRQRAVAVAPLGSPLPSTPRVGPRAAPDPADLV